MDRDCSAREKLLAHEVVTDKLLAVSSANVLRSQNSQTLTKILGSFVAQGAYRRATYL
jgi:hypothetical protein